MRWRATGCQVIVVLTSLALTSMGALSQLVMVGNNFDITSNSQLFTLGLTALKNIGGRLYFASNGHASMTTLADLSNLERVAELNISSNGNLNNIDGLRNKLVYVGTTSNNGAVTVQSNGNLSICAVNALRASLISASWANTSFSNSGNKACTTCNGAVCQ